MLLKLVAVFVIAQTLLSTLLFIKVESLEIPQTTNTSDTSQYPMRDQDGASLAKILPQPIVLTPKIVRNIVREELRILADTQIAQRQHTLQKHSGVSIADRQARLSAQNALNVLISQGQVKDKDIEHFYMSLRKLQNEDRKELLTKLAVSINSGLIKVTY